MDNDEPISRQQACQQRIFAIVHAIPPGKVMTYGQIAGLVADLCDSPVPAIMVGRAMVASARVAPDIPWWRVIGKVGNYGVLRVQHYRVQQRALLAQEGVLPDEDERYDLTRYQYRP